MALKPWVRLPTRWIEAGGLKEFHWASARSANTAALMLLAAIAHHADSADGSGVARLTYNELARATDLSRAKIADGLGVLERQGLIVRQVQGRSTYQLCGFDPQRPWGMLPAQRLYVAERIAAFQEFTLRLRTELDALKLYFLFVARRDKNANLVYITYDQMEGYTRIGRANLKRGISLLAASGLVYVEHVPSRQSKHGVATAYRLAGLDSYRHLGTSGREAL
jgi:DNA-binding transcriptional ArsR family regulator